MIKLIVNPPAGKKLESIVPSSTTDAWIFAVSGAAALTSGHDSQQKQEFQFAAITPLSTEMLKGTSSCASIFYFMCHFTQKKN